MAKYLITYDLHRPNQNYDELYEAIKKLSYDCRNSMQNVWFSKSNLTAGQIRDALKKVVDSNDELFIANLNGWASFNLKDADWLKED